MLGIFFVNVIFKKTTKEVFRPKKNFNSMHGFKSAILPELKNCQNGTFEPLHGIQKNIWPRDFF
jgi:hypothetical protein